MGIILVLYYTGPLNVCNDLIRTIPNSQALLVREKGVGGVVKNEGLAHMGGGIEETDSQALVFTTWDKVDGGIADIWIRGRDTCLGGFGSTADRVCNCINTMKYHRRVMNIPFLASYPSKSRFGSHSYPSHPSFLFPCDPPSL